VRKRQLKRNLEMAVARQAVQSASNQSRKGANTLLKEIVANELIFAVVGPAGSGTSWIAKALEQRLKTAISDVEVTVLKASDAIESWASNHGAKIKSESKLARAQSLQDAGDKIRDIDTAGVAVSLVSEIKKIRLASEKDLTPTEAAKKFRVYILDSLKHPAEVELLRSVYQEAFCLIGVVCEEGMRHSRLRDSKCRVSAGSEIDNFIARDEDSGINNGQKVTDTFHLADFFIDNTASRFLDQERKKENPLWDVNDQLGRLIDILTHSKVVRPLPSETGMFHAYGAQMTSACLSRQVGAALMDKSGNLVSTGTNEVPSAGGGVYGSNFSTQTGQTPHDHRCAYTNEFCSSNQYQEIIVKELIDTIPELKDFKLNDLKFRLKKTGIGRLLEFSRAVHAEMDALLSAARKGASPVGGRLFVTTYPCHYCARHIISAGVDEVQYIEPYPKSLAFKLHSDAIAQSIDGWVAPSDIIIKSSDKEDHPRVLFRPFTGVAPRLYKRAFIKNRPLKDGSGKMSIGEPEWASGLLRIDYKEIEDRLTANLMGSADE
jgi:deoxycytidylate deaminase/dephospho-CoA kinase